MLFDIGQVNGNKLDISIALEKIDCMFKRASNRRRWSKDTIVLSNTDSKLADRLGICPGNRHHSTIISPCFGLENRLQEKSAVSERGRHGPDSRTDTGAARRCEGVPDATVWNEVDAGSEAVQAVAE